MHLKYTLFSLFFLLIISSVDAQSDSTRASKNRLVLIQFDMKVGYGSNHVTTGMALPFAFKGNVKEGAIEKSTALLFANNRTGTRSQLSASFAYGKHQFQLGYSNIASWAYSQETFQLIFEGNSKYAGERMNLKINGKQMRFVNINYQLGQTKTKIRGNGKATVYKHEIGLYGINNFIRAKTTGDNFIETSASGLDMEAQLNFNYIANSNPIFRGAGAGYNLFIYQRKKRSVNVLKINHLGLAFVGGGTQNKYSKDTAWKYSGIGLSFGGNSNLVSYKDSLQALLFNQEDSKPMLTLLPVEISLESQSEKREYGIHYMAMPGYLPALHCLKKFKAKGKYNFALGAQAGGWGLVNSYIKLNWFIKPESTQKIQFQMLGIESLVLPYGTFAMSMRVEI